MILIAKRNPSEWGKSYPKYGLSDGFSSYGPIQLSTSTVRRDLVPGLKKFTQKLLENLSLPQKKHVFFSIFPFYSIFYHPKNHHQNVPPSFVSWAPPRLQTPHLPAAPTPTPPAPGAAAPRSRRRSSPPPTGDRNGPRDSVTNGTGEKVMKVHIIYIYIYIYQGRIDEIMK